MKGRKGKWNPLWGWWWEPWVDTVLLWLSSWETPTSAGADPRLCVLWLSLCGRHGGCSPNTNSPISPESLSCIVKSSRQDLALETSLVVCHDWKVGDPPSLMQETEWGYNLWWSRCPWKWAFVSSWKNEAQKRPWIKQLNRRRWFLSPDPCMWVSKKQGSDVLIFNPKRKF